MSLRTYCIFLTLETAIQHFWHFQPHLMAFLSICSVVMEIVSLLSHDLTTEQLNPLRKVMRCGCKIHKQQLCWALCWGFFVKVVLNFSMWNAWIIIQSNVVKHLQYLGSHVSSKKGYGYCLSQIKSLCSLMPIASIVCNCSGGLFSASVLLVKMQYEVCFQFRHCNFCFFFKTLWYFMSLWACILNKDFNSWLNPMLDRCRHCK